VGVGKTSLLISYSSASFPTEYLPTRFDTQGIGMYSEGKMVNLQLFDTFEDLQTSTRQNVLSLADVFLICYSVVSPASFESERTKWFSMVQDRWPTAKYILVGTQADLRCEKETTLSFFSESKDTGPSLSFQVPFFSPSFPSLFIVFTLFFFRKERAWRGKWERIISPK